VLDSALHTKRLRDADKRWLLQRWRGRRGAVESRHLLSLADGRAESPLESRTRLRCIDGGVPPDDLQVPVVDPRGAPVAYGDMGWRGGRLIAECDGAEWHLRLRALYDDRTRQNDVVIAQRAVLRFTWADTLRPPAYIPSVVRRGLASLLAA
jgi:hypothetical protein